MYTSLITFLYFEDFEYGNYFVSEILKLEEIMDQGFAKVFKINDSAHLGIVSKESRDLIKEDTLISLTVQDVDKAYNTINKDALHNLTEIKFFESIPLRSFFFEDKEGHHYEIQQFLQDDRF